MTYEEMAKRLEVPYCRGIQPTGHYCHEDHEGMGTVKDGVLHMSPRPISSVNNAWFLRQAARAKDPTIDTDIPWRRTYRLVMATRAMASQVGVPAPRPSKHERTFVLAGVAGEPNTTYLRKQAFDWARRGPKE